MSERLLWEADDGEDFCQLKHKADYPGYYIWCGERRVDLDKDNLIALADVIYKEFEISDPRRR